MNKLQGQVLIEYLLIAIMLVGLGIACVYGNGSFLYWVHKMHQSDQEQLAKPVP